VRIDCLEHRMHHLAPEETHAHVAARAHAGAACQSLLVRRIEVHEAQHQRAAVVGDARHQLPPRPVFDARIADRAFDLSRFAVVRVGDARQLGFVFITQRQMQREVDVALQAQALQRACRPRCTRDHPGLGYRAFLCGRFGHGTIVARE
jgi:hypothetical protein